MGAPPHSRGAVRRNMNSDALTAPESRLAQTMGEGQPVSFLTGDAKLDAPSRGTTWGPERTVRASAIARLLTATPLAGTPRRPLWIRGARISGALDLEGLVVPWPLVFENCYFDGPVILTDASIPKITLSASLLAERFEGDGLTTIGHLALTNDCLVPQGVSLRRAKVGGDFVCDDGSFGAIGGHAIIATAATVDGSILWRGAFVASGLVSLTRALVKGHVIWDGGRIENPGSSAVDGDRVTVEGDMSCSNGFEAVGTVRLAGANIKGRLTCNGGRFETDHGAAIIAEGLTVDGGMFCGAGFVARGVVRLSGATIHGPFVCDAGRFMSSGGPAIVADRSTIDGGMFCSQGFETYGGLRLLGASIRGPLVCDDGRFLGGDGPAIVADRVEVDGPVFCRDGFVAEGGAHLSDAHIKGQFACDRAHFVSDRGPAITADRLEVDGPMFCRDGFVASGGVRLSDAHIKGSLVCDGGCFASDGRDAIFAKRLTVGGGMFCRRGFEASGDVRLAECYINGPLDFTGSRLEGHSVNLQRSQVTAEFALQPSEPCRAEIDVRWAKVASMVDNAQAWRGTYHLDGFQYDSLRSSDDDPRTDGGVVARLSWLAANAGGYVPNIYDQLAQTYARAGDDEGWRRVQIAKRRAVAKNLTRVDRFTDTMAYNLLGYGYRRWRVAAWLGVLIIIGNLAFAQAYSNGLVTPKRGVSAADFSPLTYTVDLLVPVVKLGDSANWTMHGTAQDFATALKVCGWILTAAISAALADFVRRKD